MLPLLLPYCCQPDTSIRDFLVESMLFIDGHKESRRADSNRLPLLITSKPVPYSEP